ncbi:MAG: LCP family protein, partial [Chloroflexi bacterium]|nr:LCP family protein [Chloroflexota bacterium]
DMNYGFDPFYLDAGWQELDGETALKYARSRHGSDDIDRATRQQQVIFAIRDKVLSYDMIPTLVAQAPVLWNELNDNVDTGLNLDQVIELAWYGQSMPLDNINTGVLGWEYVYERFYDSQYILVPDREKLPILMTEVFGPNYNQ